MNEPRYHDPVMLAECLAGLNLREDGIYIDATFGGGGHSRAILGKLDKIRLIAFDKDEAAGANIINDNRFTLVKEDFRNIRSGLHSLGIESVDGILADLGVSSHQFDSPERGFSIRFDDEPLDMRMDPGQELHAGHILNSYKEEELAEVFYKYGELTNSRRIASVICDSRAQGRISTTGDLKRIIQRFIPRENENQFLARIFQAIRIEVNSELDSLEQLLTDSVSVTSAGARLVVISYHSLEDRMVKNFITYGNVSGKDERDVFGNRLNVSYRAINKKPLTASEEEIKYNTRARSAKLRVAERI